MNINKTHTYTTYRSFIEIFDIKTDELFSLLKFQIPLTLAFKHKTEGHFHIGYEIKVIRRVMNEGKQMVVIRDTSDLDNDEETVDYNILLDLIRIHREKTNGTMSIFVDKNVFRQKEPMFVIANNIQQQIVQSCVYIDYKDNIWSIINRPLKNGDSDKLFFFEQNNSMLVFTEDGPQLLVSPSLNSIEDLICD